MRRLFPALLVLSMIASACSRTTEPEGLAMVERDPTTASTAGVSTSASDRATTKPTAPPSEPTTTEAAGRAGHQLTQRRS
jgi:hypothetical protein